MPAARQSGVALRLPPHSIFLALALLTGCVTYEPKPLVPTETAAAFEKRTLDAPELRAFIERHSGKQLPTWPLKPGQPGTLIFNHAWNRERLTFAAYYFHPNLDVARAQWRIAQAAEVSAGGRPNPTVSVQPGYNFNAASGVVSPWLPGATIDLPIETMGKRGLRVARARRESEAAQARLQSAAWVVAAGVRNAWTRHLFSLDQLHLLDVRAGMQHRLIAKLEERLAAGAVAAAEVLPARLALQKTRLELGAAREAVAVSAAQLAEAVGVGTKEIDGASIAHGFNAGGMLIEVVAARQRALGSNPTAEEGGRFDLSRLPETATRELLNKLHLDLPASDPSMIPKLRAQSVASNSELRAALAEYEALQLMLRLELAKQYPDIHLGTGYQWDQGESKWSFLNLSAELPVLNRNQGPIAEALARREESAARVLALQARLLSTVDASAVVYGQARRQLISTLGLFEAQDRHIETQYALFKAGALDEFDRLTAELERVNAFQMFSEARRHAEEALGKLEDALQQPLDRRAGASAPPPGDAIETNPRAAKEQP